MLAKEMMSNYFINSKKLNGFNKQQLLVSTKNLRKTNSNIKNK